MLRCWVLFEVSWRRSLKCLHHPERPHRPHTRSTRSPCAGVSRRRHGYDAVTMPIVCTATYRSRSSRDRRSLRGRTEREEYGRYGNPTVRVAERRSRRSRVHDDAVLFPSGMSAVTTHAARHAQARRSRGDDLGLLSAHAAVSHDHAREVRRRATASSSRVEYGALEAAIARARTRLIITEAPTNPLSARGGHRRGSPRSSASQRGVKLLVDSTLVTPVNLRPLELGADLVLHSCTKYLGAITTCSPVRSVWREPLIAALRDARGVFGGMPDPARRVSARSAGIKTLAVRMRQHNAERPASSRVISSSIRRSSACSTRASRAIPTSRGSPASSCAASAAWSASSCAAIWSTAARFVDRTRCRSSRPRWAASRR